MGESGKQGFQLSFKPISASRVSGITSDFQWWIDSGPGVG